MTEATAHPRRLATKREATSPRLSLGVSFLIWLLLSGIGWVVLVAAINMVWATFG